MNNDDQATIKEVMQSVADEFGVDPVTIITCQRGDRNLTAARAVCAWLLQGTMNNRKIAALLGRSSKSYVHDAVSRVKLRSMKGQDLHEPMQRLLARWS